MNIYTEKVIEHFKNPRNQGKLKDYDAVGEKGNPICVPPATKIFCNSETEVIKNLEIGDRVLSHDGKYHKVKKIYKRKYSGNLVTIKTGLGEVSATEDHHILAIKIPEGQKFYRTENKKKLVNNKSWYHISDLKRRDLLLYPILKEIKDKKSIELSFKKSKWDFRSKEIPKKINLDEDFLRLCGYYLSEGSARTKTSQTYVTLTFGMKDKEHVKDAAKIVKKIFGIDAKINYKPERKTINVVIYSVEVTKIFKILFGKGAENKRIPHFMMILPPMKQKGLISGLWKGDGYLNPKKPRAGYATISYELSQQIKTLLLRQGIIPSIYKEKEKVLKGVKHRKSYRIHIGDRFSLKKLAKILGKTLTTKKDSMAISWMDENYLYTPISKVESKYYNGYVHNLDVEESKTYVTEPAILHNCGDVMHIYIKVKNDRIVDIGWETMGCAAAIATTSILSEMAKGKTLDEAMKLTRENVADELDGLPPVKMHCSNLAADALHEAIKNYREKHKKVKSK